MKASKIYLILLIVILSACQQTPPVPEGTVNSFDGIPIHYESKGAGDIALVFVHGWCIDGSYWESQVDYFADRYQVVRLDLAGHGLSSIDRKEWSMPAFGEDVAAVVKHLNLKNVILVGHSMGDIVVVEAANRLAGRVIGLLGVDTFVDPGSQIPKTQSDGLLSALRDDFGRAVRQWMGFYFPEYGDSTFKEAVLSDMAEGPMEICTPILEALFTYQNSGAYRLALSKLSVPIQTINMYKVDLAAWQKVGIEVTEIRIDSVSHYPMKEVPEEINRLLENAISATLSTTNGK